jgi:hypothetical protein
MRSGYCLSRAFFSTAACSLPGICFGPSFTVSVLSLNDEGSAVRTLYTFTFFETASTNDSIAKRSSSEDHL